jgi:hypothetical protein
VESLPDLAVVEEENERNWILVMRNEGDRPRLERRASTLNLEGFFATFFLRDLLTSVQLST